MQEDVIAQQENLNDRLDECYNGNESIRASNAENYFMKRFEEARLGNGSAPKSVCARR